MRLSEIAGLVLRRVPIKKMLIKLLKYLRLSTSADFCKTGEYVGSRPWREAKIIHLEGLELSNSYKSQAAPRNITTMESVGDL